MNKSLEENGILKFAQLIFPFPQWETSTTAHVCNVQFTLCSRNILTSPNWRWPLNTFTIEEFFLELWCFVQIFRSSELYEYFSLAYSLKKKMLIFIEVSYNFRICADIASVRMTSLHRHHAEACISDSSPCTYTSHTPKMHIVMCQWNKSHFRSK